MKLLFLGDSITDAYHCFDPENLGEGYVRMIYEKLNSDPNGSCCFDAAAKFLVSNKGIDGFTVSRVYGMWQSLPNKSRWDTVSVLVGINDVGAWIDCGHSDSWINGAVLDFARTYEDLVTDFLDYNIRQILLMEPFLFPCPENYQLWMPWRKKLSSHIQSIARRYGGTFLPLQDVLENAARMEGASAITPDGIHLTERGNRLLADCWLKRFPH